MGAGMCTKVPYGMGEGIKVVVHEGTGSDTSIFYRRRYGERHRSTLSIKYPLPSLG